VDEDNSESGSQNDGPLSTVGQLTLPIAVEYASSVRRLLPGIPTTVQFSRGSIYALRFSSRAGSNKLAILADDHGRDAYLVDLLSMSHPDDRGSTTCTIRCSDRLVLCSPPQLDTNQEYLVGRFSKSNDETQDKERQCDLLIQIRCELDAQFSIVGQSGKSRLLSFLESMPWFQSTERQFFTCPDLSYIRGLLSSNYSHFDRLSFLLMSVIFISADPSTIETLVFSRSTIRRLEAIRAALKQSSVLLLEPWERANLSLRFLSSSESLLRGTSPLSAVVLLAVALFFLLLKGKGYLGFETFVFFNLFCVSFQYQCHLLRQAAHRHSKKSREVSQKLVTL
jgi:hypothetical protein